MEYVTFEDKNVKDNKVNLDNINIFGIDGLFTIDKLEDLIIKSWNDISKNKLSDVNSIILELLNKDFKKSFNIKHNNFEKIGLEYSKNKNKRYENILIFLDIIRKYVVISLLNNLHYDGKKLFNKTGMINSKYGVIVAPGSGNVTSDWDITFFLTHEGIEFFKKSKVSKESLSWLKQECSFYNFFDKHYGNFSLIYDNNFYIEMCEKKGRFYKIPLFLKKYKLDETEFLKIELKYLKKKEKGSGDVSLKKQIDFISKAFENIDEPEISFKNYLSSRIHKSEAYATLSSVICVVIEGQLGINIQNILRKYFGLYLMSSLENTLDLKKHINKYGDSILKNKKGYKIILKYSKYLKRINDNLKFFERYLLSMIDKDNNKLLDNEEFKKFKNVISPIYGDNFDFDNVKGIELKRIKDVKTHKCFGKSSDHLEDLVSLRGKKADKNGEKTPEMLIDLINEDIKCIENNYSNPLNNMETYTILYSKFLEIIKNYIKLQEGEKNKKKTVRKKRTKRKKG
jgi:hypothetical protein